MIKVFDYKCLGCDDIAEHWLKGDATPTCKVCQSTDLKRLPSATPGFVEKGPYERYISKMGD